MKDPLPCVPLSAESRGSCGPPTGGTSGRREHVCVFRAWPLEEKEQPRLLLWAGPPPEGGIAWRESGRLGCGSTSVTSFTLGHWVPTVKRAEDPPLPPTLRARESLLGVGCFLGALSSLKAALAEGLLRGAPKIGVAEAEQPRPGRNGPCAGSWGLKEARLKGIAS